MATITIHTSVFHPWEEWEDEPTLKDSYSETYDTADYTEDLGDWSEDSDYNDNEEWVGTWVHASTACVGTELLSGHGAQFYASETSASPTDGVNVWYIEETYIHPYSGERVEERTAHLSGFTEEEQREIHAALFPPRS